MWWGILFALPGALNAGQMASGKTVALLHMNDSGNYVESVSGVSATVTGALARVPGKFGAGVGYADDSTRKGLNLPVLTFDTGTAWAACQWIKTTNITVNSMPAWMSYGNTCATGGASIFSLFNHNGAAQASKMTDVLVGTSGGTYEGYFSYPPLYDGKWHLYCMSAAGARLRVTVDLAVVLDVALAFTVPKLCPDIDLGNVNWGPALYARGHVIDEAFILSGFLSSGRLAAIYTEGLGRHSHD